MNGNYSKIRPASVAGTFYSASPRGLRDELESRMEAAPVVAVEGRIVSAAVPHAGYVFSAEIAAPVFKALRNTEFDTVVVIGHDFGEHAPGIIAVLPDYDAFHTPLGDVKVDTDLCKALLKRDRRFICNNRVHDEEHSVEVQLPWLQLTHPDAAIVPVLFGEVTPEHCRRFAELLAEEAGDRKIFVLSSTDMSHYPTAENSKLLDLKTTSFAESFDLDGLCAWRSHGEWEEKSNVVTPICSAGGLGTAMCWAEMQGEAKTVVAKRGNSADASGDASRTVGYASMLFTIDSKAEFEIPQDVQKTLLELARQSIGDGTAGKQTQLPELRGAIYRRAAAVFVTLHKNGRLRGCIGTTAATMPLARAIVEYARAAAFEDPRFPEVTSDELADIVIEISILSPMRRIANADEIVPNVHGVVVRSGRRAGLFLPQVWEQLPDKAQFLGYLCAEKAGLPFDSWRNPETELSVFTVVAFEEKQP